VTGISAEGSGRKPDIRMGRPRGWRLDQPPRFSARPARELSIVEPAVRL